MSNIRNFLCSRFGKNGKILEIDYSQLEIYVLAHLSGDATLKSDLLSGKDLHSISAKMLFGNKFTPKQRKIAKSLSFQLQYGAGYKSMALQNGISEGLAKRFIDNYYNRYPGVKMYQDKLAKVVERNREQSSLRTKKGLPAGISKFQSETGRIYTFIEDDAPEWMHRPAGRGPAKHTTFSPTKIKNYQVQGYATGDIVPMAIGRLFRELCKYNMEYDGKPVFFINTVHDSVVFDCKNMKHAINWAIRAKEIMEGIPKDMKKYLNVDFSMPLKVDVEIGSNWNDMTEIDMDKALALGPP